MRVNAPPGGPAAFCGVTPPFGTVRAVQGRGRGEEKWEKRERKRRKANGIEKGLGRKEKREQNKLRQREWLNMCDLRCCAAQPLNTSFTLECFNWATAQNPLQYRFQVSLGKRPRGPGALGR